MEETTGKTAGGRTRPVYGAAEDRRTAFIGLHYYMQDELGSPLRVSGYRKKEGSFIGRSEYLTYGYDEFGNDLGKELDEAGIPDPYDRQGAEQPFGYTGYRYDEIGGTYFAQAREYQPGNGRFTAEDVIKGNGVDLAMLNQYSYCWNNPIKLIDYNGKFPIVPFVPTIPSPMGISDSFKEDIEEIKSNIKEIGKDIYNNVKNVVVKWGEEHPDNVVAQVVTGKIGLEFSSEELKLMIENPIDAGIFLYNGYKATKLTQEKFGYMPEDGTIGNAYRHAMWNALLKQSFFSETKAKKWTNAHEAYPEEKLLSEGWQGHTRKEHSEMDLHNNSIGLSSIKWYEFWVSEDEISDRIMEHIKNGDMITLVEDPRCTLEGD